MTDRVRRWWRYPFAVAGPATLAVAAVIAGSGAASALAFPRTWQFWPPTAIAAVAFLVVQVARRRFMKRQGIVPSGARIPVRRQIVAAALGVGAVLVVLAIGWDPAWAWPLSAALLFAEEARWRLRWAKLGYAGDPRWASNWSPEVDPAYEFRAIPEFRGGRYEEAKLLLRKGLERKPGDQGILYNLACAEARTGQMEAALDHLIAATDGNPRLLRSAQADADLASIRDDPRFPR